MTFAPSTRRIYVRSVRMAIGLQVIVPPRPPRGRLLCDSCSSGQSFAYGFLPASPREATVAVQLGVPSHRGPQGTLTPKSLPAWLSPHGYFPPIGGTRHAWRTKRSPVDSTSRPGPGTGVLDATPRHPLTSSPRPKTTPTPSKPPPTSPSTHPSLRIGRQMDSNGCVSKALEQPSTTGL